MPERLYAISERNFLQRVVVITLFFVLCLNAAYLLVFQPAHLFAQSSPPPILSKQNLYFERLSYEQGLSESNVTAILQDRSGFLWVGTTNGLNRFDGYKFSIFRHNPADSTSLGNNTITALHEDRTGTLWVGTQNGVSAFDRRRGTFTTFRYVAGTTSTLSSNNIRAIAEDSAGNIWIGTKRGLNRFDALTKTFTYFKADKKKTDASWRGKGPTDNDIVALRILPATPHILWIGARTGGMNALDLRTLKFAAFPIDDESAQESENESSSATNGIATMTSDNDGNIWVGTRTDGVVFQFSTATRTGTRFTFKSERTDVSPEQSAIDIDQTTRTSPVHALYVDAAKNLWVGTRLGLWRYDAREQRWASYTNSPTDPNSISDNDINTIFQDRTGVLWFGTQAGGLSKFVPQSASFQVFKYDPTSWNNGLSGGNVTALAENYSAERGEIWVATSKGLSTMLPDGTLRLETGFNALLQNKSSAPLQTALANKPILALLQTRKGTLWIGTERGLVQAERSKTGAWTIKVLSSRSESSSALSDDIVSVLLEDKQGNIWAGTQGGGVNRINPNTNEVTQFFADSETPRTLGDNFVFSMLCDARGTIWVGTSNGLARFDAENQDFTVFQRRIEKSDKMGTSNGALRSEDVIALPLFPDVPILSIHEHLGVLWLGTLGGGLYRFDPQSRITTRFGRDENLPSETVYGILNDSKNNLWLTTPRGLVMVRLSGQTFTQNTTPSNTPSNTSNALNVRVYNASDGLHSNTFHQGAALRTSGGMMVFGVGMGVMRFVPERLQANATPPQLGFVRFKVFGEREIAETLSVGDTLTIEYNDNFEIEYTALDFTNIPKNEYAYKIEGPSMENVWRYQGGGRTVTGMNFDAGTYTFHIKGANSDGVWNEEGARLTLIVRPPWWETWWFRTIAAFVSIGAVVGGYKFRVRSINRQNERLTKLVEERTSTLQEQSRQMEAQATEIQLSNVALQEKNMQLGKILHESEEARTELQRAYTLLDAENARKTQELEEARTFQVLMLPKFTPQVTGLDVAFEMRTATEVGGDYYDYVLEEDGTLTLAIGDATGHGVRAGMLVSLVKSSFHALAGEADLGTIVSAISQTIKQMNLQRMFMCLTLVRIRKRFVETQSTTTPTNTVFSVEFAGAGMPPMLHYSAQEGRISELRPHGIALGIMNNAQYPTEAITLERGDVLLISSDGLMELFNAENEELGMTRLHEIFLQELLGKPQGTSLVSANGIITGLYAAADAWRGEVAAADDIALVAVRVEG
jgi:ligand-binding sensor domain-containing protein/serine phosphatase RsbU (regulator of sigma subunit)